MPHSHLLSHCPFHVECAGVVEQGLHLPGLPAFWDEVLDDHHLPALVGELLQHIVLQPPAREERRTEGAEERGCCGGSVPDHYSLLQVELQLLEVRRSTEVPPPGVLGGTTTTDICCLTPPATPPPAPPTLLPSQYLIPKSTNDMLRDVSTAATCM